MIKALLQAVTGVALAFLVACSQPDVKDEHSTKGSEDLKTLSSKLGQPYLMNDQGEIISEIPPIVLEKIKQDLKQQAKMAEYSELERLYDPETGKLRDFEKLGEIQNKLDKLAAEANLSTLNGGNQ